MSVWLVCVTLCIRNMANEPHLLFRSDVFFEHLQKHNTHLGNPETCFRVCVYQEVTSLHHLQTANLPFVQWYWRRRVEAEEVWGVCVCVWAREGVEWACRDKQEWLDLCQRLQNRRSQVLWWKLINLGCTDY